MKARYNEPRAPARLRGTLFAALLGIVASTALAQQPIVIGQSVVVASRLLHEERRLLIGEPAHYAGNDQRYAVMYLLDGDEQFSHAASLVRFLSASEFIPPLLVVGIANTDRDRDFYTSSDGRREKQVAPSSGGADQFFQCLKTELVPWVDEHYRTNHYRILFGHSAGGFFAIYTMLQHPDVFDAYVAASPSIWWDDGLLNRLAESELNAHAVRRAKVFVGLGNEGAESERSLATLKAILDRVDSDQFALKYVQMRDEIHLTTPHRTVYQGLEFIFDGWFLRDPVALFDKAGIAGIHDHFRRLDEEFDYDRGTPANVIRLLGGVFFETNRLDDLAALVLYDPYRYPSPPDGLDELASRFEARGDEDKAIQFYTQALRASPSNRTARTRLQKLGVNVDALVDAVAPDESLLRKLAGRYRLPNGTVWEFRVTDRGLVTMINGHPQELTMRGPTEYTLGFSYLLFSFSVDEAANSTTLRAKAINSAWATAERIPN